ncbi:MAG: hypothetical protein H0W37_03360 [Pseudonocardiales bacterium]|nr:hypothetical protein [Pseudonocardiales bacterium]
MSWQDELRNLDEELAAGRLSAEDYRRRSDELNAQDPSGQPGSVDAVQSPPFPPAFRWETALPSETTQGMQPVGDDEAERTQVVHDASPPTQSPPAQTPDDFERTQVVSAGQRPPQHRLDRGGFSPRSLFEPRNAQDSAPPWASSDLPPIQEPGSGWMMQGPEAFEPERESGTWKIVGAVVAVVVLLGLAIGSYALWGRDDTPTAQPEPPAAEQRAPADPLMPADIGGAEESKDVETFADLDAVGFLTQSELGVLENAAAGDTRLLISSFDEGKATVLVTRVGSPEQAVVARDELTSLLLSFGFGPRSAPPGVNAVELPDDAETTPKVRAVYLSGDILVRLEMVGQDPAGVAAKFDDVLSQQLEVLPADA